MANTMPQDLLAQPVMRYLMYAVVGMLLSVVHLVLFKFIAVESITPDLILILVIWIALSEGQFVGLIAGFAFGLFYDVVSPNVLGTNALAKTVAGFAAGYFFKEGFAMQTIGSFRFLFIVAVCAFIHNLIYHFFYIQPMDVSFGGFFLTYGVAMTLYTTVVAVFPMLFVNRRQDG